MEFLIEAVLAEQYNLPLSHLQYAKANYILIKSLNFFGVKEQQLTSSRKHEFVSMRYIIMYFLSRHTGLTAQEIVNMLSQKSRELIFHANKKMKYRLENEDGFLERMARLRDTMNF